MISEEVGTVAQGQERGLEVFQTHRGLTDPLFMFKFSASVVFTLRLRDKGDSFCKGWSFFLVILNIFKFYIEMFEVCP